VLIKSALGSLMCCEISCHSARNRRWRHQTSAYDKVSRVLVRSRSQPLGSYIARRGIPIISQEAETPPLLWQGGIFAWLGGGSCRKTRCCPRRRAKVYFSQLAKTRCGLRAPADSPFFICYVQTNNCKQLRLFLLCRARCC